MIITRKPFILYDVDLLGGCALLALAVAGVYLVLFPWQNTWREHDRMAAARVDAHAHLVAAVGALEQFERHLVPLEQTVQTEAQAIPRVDNVSQLLRNITDIAADCNLELRSVAPQPAAPAGAYLVSDVNIGGRGRAQDFIRFLDRLAQANPCQSLRTCTISREGDALAPCDLAYTLRLFLVPADAPKATAGGGS